ncbi:MAG TPA: SDR family oxidoreductase [bacterium]
MLNKILVTGATGNAGNEVAKALAARGLRVKAAVHTAEKAALLKSTRAERIAFDLIQPNTWGGALSGVDGLFLVSPTMVPGSLQAVLNFIDKAKSAGVKYVVNLSAKGVEMVDDAPLRIIEKKVEASGIPFTHLRPTWFMQNFSSFHRDVIAKQGAIYLPAGDAKTAFIDCRDIASVALICFSQTGHAGKAYALTGSEALDHHQVAALISKAIGREVKYHALSDDDARQGLKAQGWPPEAVEYMIMLYGFVRAGFAADITPDVEKILKRKPLVFEQYVRDDADAWK